MKESHKFSDNWVLRFGSLFSVPIQAHISFLGLLAIAYMGVGPIVTLGFVLSLVAHEYAHVLVGKRNGVKTESVTLFLVGAVAQMRLKTDGPWKEFKIAIAGPAMSVLLGTIFLGTTYFFQAPETLEGFSLKTMDPWAILFALSIVNFMLGIFNMVPAFPMDGGRVLRALLSLKFSRLVATRYSMRVAAVFCMAGFLFGFWIKDIVLIVISPLIFMGAYGEYRQELDAAFRKALSDSLVTFTQELHNPNLPEELRDEYDLGRVAAEQILTEMEKRDHEVMTKVPKTNLGKLVTVMIVTSFSFSYFYEQMFKHFDIGGGIVLNIIATFITLIVVMRYARPIYTNKANSKQGL